MAEVMSRAGHKRGAKAPSAGGHWLMGSWKELIEDPLGFHLRMAREHGDVVRYRVGPFEAYFVNHPEGVQRILQENHRNYNKDTFDYKVLKMAAGEGLLTSDGAFWLRQRRMIQPIFSRKRIDGFAALMVEQGEQLAARWLEQSGPDSCVDVAEDMMWLTLVIVGKALFQMELGEEAQEIGSSFGMISEHLGTIDAQTFIPKWLPVGRVARFRKALGTLDGIVYRMINRRRAELQTRKEHPEGDDLLSLLLLAVDPETGEKMDDKQVRDEAITLLVAGHETTANALAWTWYLLSEHPEVEARLHQELDTVLGGRAPTVADLQQLPYTLMVIEESMRLYPPAWLLSRKAVEADTICGMRIPAGANVTASPYVTQRHPDAWEDPERFWPERFSPEKSEGRDRYAHFPFGGGPRLCIGRHFAMMEMHLVLAHLAQHFCLKLHPDAKVVPEPLITTRPKYGLKMSIHKR